MIQSNSKDIWVVHVSLCFKRTRGSRAYECLLLQFDGGPPVRVAALAPPMGLTVDHAQITRASCTNSDDGLDCIFNNLSISTPNILIQGFYARQGQSLLRDIVSVFVYHSHREWFRYFTQRYASQPVKITTSTKTMPKDVQFEYDKLKKLW